MIEKDLISIIVPVYNIEKYIERCILSIISQTYKNLQIIVVDDGSTDNSGKLCDSYAQNDKRIHVIHQNNKGLVCARKAGLRIANGDYIAFVDGDDYIDADMYADMLQDIRSTQADFVHAGFFIEKNGSTTARFLYENEIHNIADRRIEFLRDFVIDPSQESIMSYSIWSKLFKRELIMKCYQKVPDSQPYGEDLLALCACVMESSCIYMKKTAHYHYVYRSSSMTNQCGAQVVLDMGDLYRNLCHMAEQYSCYDELNYSLVRWFKLQLIAGIQSMDGRNVCIQRYIFPDVRLLFGKRIALYGAGAVGQDYYAQISRYQECRIVAWADKNAAGYRFDYVDVIGVDSLKKYDFDILLIAVNQRKLAKQIRAELIEGSICEAGRITWKKPQYIL